MYANLKVTVAPLDGGDVETYSAWRVASASDGAVLVYEDLNDGGNYLEEGAVLRFPPGTPIVVEPCW